MTSSFVSRHLRSVAARLPARSSLKLTRLRAAALVAILAVFVVGAVLRFDSIGTEPRISSDENGNYINTNAIINGTHYRTFRWAPGTPFMFAMATEARNYPQLSIGPHSRGPAQYSQFMVELATLALMVVVAWWLAGPWAALLAVTLAALYIPLILITRTYLSEPLGGLMILATFAGAAWARKRGLLAISAAGVLAGFGCLAREDLFPGVIVITIALALALWRTSRRQALVHSLVYLLCAIVVITPWVVYASNTTGRFVPITNGGGDALFIGTYLPGHGRLYPDTVLFRKQICKRYPIDCPRFSVYGAVDMLKIVAARYPNVSYDDAINKAVLHNLRVYALGRPFAFTGMLASKLWRMWTQPWSGGVKVNKYTKLPTSRVQHLFFVAIAWIGLLGGALVTRRWSLLTVTAGLALITALNIVVNAQGRDNVRLMPLLLTFGAAGAWMLVNELWLRYRRRRSGAPQPEGDSVAVPV